MAGNGKNGRLIRTAHHPDETKVNLGNRLRRIEGQIRGIARMVDSDVYCDDILNQITSVEAALSGVRKGLLEAHIRSCVMDQIEEGRYEVIAELMKTIGRMSR
ncbi:MAG: metal-sensitive transcriptional regulator [Spirochaetia bacterium]|jgi:DNA-binding FrmR family transcriptional regulator|nr:metal-sensitive transcriptional regulator [Spirochaetales bacterium]